MFVEGMGWIRPTPVRVTVNLEQGRQMADQRESYRSYRTRTENWGVGFIPNAVFVGMLGELAVADFLTHTMHEPHEVDTTPQRLGDGGCDFQVNGIRIQVKTERAVGYYYPNLLLRRYRDNGTICRFPWTCVIGCRYTPDTNFVELLGYCSRQECLTHGELRPAKQGNHMNLEVPYTRFHSIRDLPYQLREQTPALCNSDSEDE